MRESAAPALLLSAAMGALFGGPVRAQDACAKYDDAFAYNQCLATQGPKAHATRAVDVPAGESAAAPGWRRGRVHTSLEVFRRRGGRMIAEFTIAPRPKRQKPPDEP